MPRTTASQRPACRVPRTAYRVPTQRGGPVVGLFDGVAGAVRIADDDFGDGRGVVHDEDPTACPLGDGLRMPGGRGVLHDHHCGAPVRARRRTTTPIRPMSMFRKNLMT